MQNDEQATVEKIKVLFDRLSTSEQEQIGRFIRDSVGEKRNNKVLAKGLMSALIGMVGGKGEASAQSNNPASQE